MLRSDVIKSMRSVVGGGWFINKTEIARALGRKRLEFADKYVRDLQKVSGGLYYIPEVAEKVMEDIT